MHGPHDPLKGNRRAQEEWMIMVSELDDMGFTFIKGKSAWTFTCCHGKVTFSVYRNLAAFRNGDWDGIVTHARAEEGRKCKKR